MLLILQLHDESATASLLILRASSVEFNAPTSGWDLSTNITAATTTTTIVDLAYVTIIIIAYAG